MFKFFGIYEELTKNIDAGEIKDRFTRTIGNSIEKYNTWENERALFIFHPGLKYLYEPSSGVFLVFWGSIYNYFLKDIIDRYKKSGLEFLDELNGKFGLILYDIKKRHFYCIRDRFGIERIYYAQTGHGLLLASHITPIIKSGQIEARANYEKIYNFMKYSIAWGDNTFFKDINEIPMGNYLSINGEEINQIQWYSIDRNISRGLKKETDAKTLFVEIMYRSIEERMKDSEKVGLALSGGPDSSFVVSIAADIEKKLKTNREYYIFSLRFDNQSVDEGPYIKAVVDSLESKLSNNQIVLHHIYPAADDLVTNFYEIVKYFEEPFHKIHPFMYRTLTQYAASVNIPYILLGQGAESIIGGQTAADYFVSAAQYLGKFRFVNFFKEVIAVAKNREIKMSSSFLRSLYPLVPFLIEKIKSPRQKLRDSFMDPGFVKRKYEKVEVPVLFKNLLTQNILSDLYSQPDEFRQFTKNKFCLEVDMRFPFMDHRLVELAYSLPNELKVHRGVSKVILRDDPKILPGKVRNRQDKMMSSRIEQHWFRGPLAEFTKDIIESNSFKNRNIFNIKQVRNALDLHIKGERNLAKEISRWLTIELWFRLFIDTNS
jgi:asparagine synthase (glutamine-hydrolysing)